MIYLPTGDPFADRSEDPFKNAVMFFAEGVIAAMIFNFLFKKNDK